MAAQTSAACSLMLTTGHSCCRTSEITYVCTLNHPHPCIKPPQWAHQRVLPYVFRVLEPQGAHPAQVLPVHQRKAAHLQVRRWVGS